ncbi:MAG TPA: acetyl-CoA acetyltransferase [Dehalococcoidia bacterium]|nr:acetyl-CoA acetyltransferase [Dehalococcoidia bacterium]
MPGIKDRVAVVGVGCTKFGEIWEKDQEDLLVESVYEALDDAGLTPQDIDAGWVGLMYNFTGFSGATMTEPLKLFGKPVTRVENFCASGMDAFRNACFAVAAGVYDVVVACGVEKLLDQGGGGIPIDPIHPVLGHASAPAMFALAASRAFHEWGWTKEDLANVAVKNHKNGAAHPKAHFRRPITVADAVNAPMISWPLGRFDCCAVSDGSAAIVITRPEIAKDTKHKDDYVVVKANALAIQSLQPMYKVSYNWLGFPATRDAARVAYAEAGITDPLKEISFAEVHDCFTSTELFNIGDLGFVADGKDAPAFVRDGHADVEGEVPINPSGGLKCFGHPIGATGCRMIYEVTKQLQGRADGMQVKDPKLGMAHNLGGPGSVCSVTILGRHD